MSLVAGSSVLTMMASYTRSVRTDSLAPGTELIVDRLVYRHHGIYVGGGLVIHYAGWISYRHGLIEVIPLGNFASRRPIRVGRVPTESLHGEDIVRRARSRLGERCYDVLKNNCEHFCSWCQIGESRSTQVDLLLQQMRRVMHVVHNLLPLGQLAHLVGQYRPGSHSWRSAVAGRRPAVPSWAQDPTRSAVLTKPQKRRAFSMASQHCHPNPVECPKCEKTNSRSRFRSRTSTFTSWLRLCPRMSLQR